MKKAIIITVSSEYSAYEEFNRAIENPELCDYNSKKSLIKFLAARKQWEEIRNRSSSNREAYKTLLKKDCPEGMRGEDIPYAAIKGKMETVTLDKVFSPYASLPPGNGWEIILVLCDRINVGRTECVSPVNLFLDCICEDLKPFDAKDNVLFIHAEQIGFQGDGIIVDNHEVKYSSENEGISVWTNANKHQFNRIAFFAHIIGRKALFDGNILKKDFLGKTFIHDIWDEEN